MTKELNCTSCGVPATLTKTLPLCARCGLAISQEALGFVFDGLRGDAGVIELPSPAVPGMTPKEANDVAYQYLAALKRRGVKRVTIRDFKELMETTGRSRPWVYRWLDARVADRELVKDKNAAEDLVGYTFAY